MKVCVTCKIEKDELEFRKRSTLGGTIHKVCKLCHSKRYQETKDTTNEKRRIKYLTNSEIIKERGRRYHSLNKESIRERKRNNRLLNKELINQQAREDYKKNPEPKKRRSTTWIKKNSDRHSARNARRRATKLLQTPKWSDPKETMIFHIEAARLTKETGIKYSVDHIVPLKHPYVSGFDTPANLRVIPLKDNIEKGNRWWLDMPDYTQVVYDPITNTLIEQE